MKTFKLEQLLKNLPLEDPQRPALERELKGKQDKKILAEAILGFKTIDSHPTTTGTRYLKVGVSNVAGPCKVIIDLVTHIPSRRKEKNRSHERVLVMYETITDEEAKELMIDSSI